MLLTCFYVYAQPHLEPVSLDLPKKTEKPIEAFAIESGGYISYVHEKILKIDENLTSVTGFPYEYLDDYWFVKYYDNKEEVLSFYTKKEKKQDVQSLYVCKFKKDGSNYAFNPKKIFSQVIENKDAVKRFIAKSEDGSKITFSFVVTDKKKIFKGLRTVVMDQNGNILWDVVTQPQFNNKTFYMDDVQVSNAGEVYFCVRAHEDNGRGSSATNERLHLLIITENGLEMIDEVVDFGNIKDMNMKILSNGNVFIAGYYAKTLKDEPCGSFSTMYNSNQNSFSAITHIDMKDQIAGKINSKFNIVNRGFYELSNGNIVFIGEEISSIYYSPSQGTAYYIHALKDVFIHTYNSAGEEISTQKLEKDQATVQPYSGVNNRNIFGSSIRCFQVRDDIYIIYNDHVDNVAGELESPKKIAYAIEISYSIAGNSCTVLAKISQGEEITKNVINIADETNLTFQNVLCHNDESALLFFTKKKGADVFRKLIW